MKTPEMYYLLASFSPKLLQLQVENMFWSDARTNQTASISAFLLVHLREGFHKPLVKMFV